MHCTGTDSTETHVASLSVMVAMVEWQGRNNPWPPELEMLVSLGGSIDIELDGTFSSVKIM